MGSRKRKKKQSEVKPVTTSQIAYIDIRDANGNLIKRAELEPDVRDYSGLMQIAVEEVELDEFHLVPLIRRQQQLERQIFKEAQKIRGRKTTPIHNPHSW